MPFFFEILKKQLYEKEGLLSFYFFIHLYGKCHSAGQASEIDFDWSVDERQAPNVVSAFLQF